MGILSKIIEPKILPPKKQTSKPPENFRPSKPCPAGHPLPYGLNFWLDPFGDWHCIDCLPPHSMAQVKDQAFIGSGSAPQSATEQDFFVAQGIAIIAISTSDGVTVFNPATTQAERRIVVDNLAWFDRSDKAALTIKK